MEILISGGTGLVGKRLTKLLEKQGHGVQHLSRSPKTNSGNKTIVWDPANKTVDAEKLKGIDYIFHLAGAGVADKSWTSDYKNTITASRIESTKLLFDALSQLEKKPKGLVSASAVGYYGIKTTDTIYNESDSPGSDFHGDE